MAIGAWKLTRARLNEVACANCQSVLKQCFKVQTLKNYSEKNIHCQLTASR